MEKIKRRKINFEAAGVIIIDLKSIADRHLNNGIK